MSLQYVEHICRANNIGLYLGKHHVPKHCTYNEWSGTSNMYGRNGNYTKSIIIGVKAELKEIVAWHELGHLMHEYGFVAGLQNATKFELMDELAANAWVFQNYIGNYSLDKVVIYLKKCIMTYIDGGYVYGVKYDWSESAAKRLGIYDLITWVE